MSAREELIVLATEGTRARRRRKAWQRFWTRLLINVLAAFLGGFWLMLAVGMLHREWWQAMPTIGYWWAVLTVGLLRGVFSRIDYKDDPS